MIVERHLDVDCLTAARQRIRNVFSNGLPVYLAFSGGKDSLVLADITVKMLQAGELDASRLRVEFIDEEAIFPCVEEVVKEWRTKFMLLGARFDWYCLEVKHFSCLNQLENDESFICWDRFKEDVWIRRPPPWAIRTHPFLPQDPYLARTEWYGARADTYQTFLGRVCDGPRMTGLRVFESLQRRTGLAQKKPMTMAAHWSGGFQETNPQVEPIYDWRDDDVWYYLAKNDIAIPAAYMHLYQIGVSRKALRISQFFSVDTAQSLARMAEFYPDLMERILRREPAAYIVSLYWDSEMFRRRTPQRREMERRADVDPDEAKRKVFALLRDVDANFHTEEQREVAHAYRRIVLMSPYIGPKHYGKIYDALIAGDPKRRSLRAIISNISRDAANQHVPGNAPLTITRAGNVGAPRAARRPQAE